MRTKMIPSKLTSRVIGEHCGIPERTIRDWQAKGIIPKTEDLSVMVQAVVAYYKEQVNEARSRRCDEDDDELYLEKVRLTRAQADKATLEVQVREGELVSARETVLAWSTYILSCRSRLLSLPTKLASELAGIDRPTLIQRILQEAVDEALIELGGEDFVDECQGSTQADDESICAAA